MARSLKKNVNDFPVRKFIIRGLYGYKTLQFESRGKTTIVVSENGSGKTTLLNTLYNTLRGDVSQLSKIDFSEISITLNDGQTFLIKKDELCSIYDFDLEHFFDTIDDEEIEYDAQAIAMAVNEVSPQNFEDHYILENLYNSIPDSRREFIDKLMFIRAKIQDRQVSINNSIKNLKSIKVKFNDYECVYLPTYRRVEKVFSKKKNLIRIEHIDGMSRKIFSNNKNNITYGLDDVEETLKEISFTIERKSNLVFRALSIDVLNDLLDQKSLTAKKKLPDLNTLKRFLSRVRDVKRNSIITKLEEFYLGNTEVRDTHFLNYFLFRLNDVINETKELEFKIENFVNECNKYLTISGDSKEILFDPDNLKVKVEDCFTKNQIQLNDLSSGEKQVISFMSMLYLTEKRKKIILIDEPELSLSLDWQRKILPDINRSENVFQVIAITHSPFIFENELDKNATALKITKEQYNNDKKSSK